MLCENGVIMDKVERTVFQGFFGGWLEYTHETCVKQTF